MTRSFFVHLPGRESVHDSREEALDELRSGASTVDTDDPNVSVAEVTVDGNDWQIAELPWQQIALELLNGGEA
jgi:hypothetical protein